MAENQYAVINLKHAAEAILTLYACFHFYPRVLYTLVYTHVIYTKITPVCHRCMQHVYANNMHAFNIAVKLLSGTVF